MKILFIADPHIPVPPLKYGGAERIVDIYATEFKRLGHQVDIMAGLGSRNNGGCLHVHQAPTMAYHSRARRKLQFQLQSLWAARDADVVYNHGRFDYMQSLLCINKPSVHAFHNPIDQQQIDSAEALIRSRFAFQCLSENQRSQVRISHPVHIIPNPVNSSIYQLGSGEGGYLAFLGRLTANKGVDAAIDVAHRTGQRLVIAGNQSTEEGASKYFRQAISPHLDGDQIRWIGPVDDAQKHELLAGASALLFPIRWDEPFGMVMIEALACGTPVIATRMGSTPEVIDHGSTGFLCDTVEDMVQAIKDLSAISRSDCRTVAETRFDVRTIAPRILEILYQLASKEKF
ncbi:glycosyltransferase family 4 protein [Synechococcus sp. CS-1327]|uniref:glycosyltransferase family 4 protein n=1 Tax=Synechococcus sp. CS-1327 TaxID=2847977 RepID=UPI00223AE89D|nr:glycosyltransferase family 4 protein [Synechococcus sp. CS-1327]MCT0233009.1 glycosyltransferase family 4 protein [Synechococcus sp. CS-1327]